MALSPANGHTTEHYRVMQIFLPFAAAYLLSYVMRSVNAVLSEPLTAELGLSASQLGLLSGAYLLTFAAMQIPLGALLDRKGPRNIELILLTLAILGCVISALAVNFFWLWVGRALIGLGVSACLMASYKAYRICFAAERQSSLASLMLMVGSLGALIATVPVELALPLIGWRGIFWLTAGLFVLSTLALLWWLPPLPDPEPNHRPFWRDTWVGVKEVFAHREIQRLIPFATFIHGGFLAVQGLWMGPWFRVVDGKSSSDAAFALLVLGVVVMFSHMAMSYVGTRFKDWGWSLDRVLQVGSLLLLLLTAAAVLDLWNHSVLGWSLMVTATCITGVGYAKASLAFPVSMAGRASTTINFIVFVGAFAMQWGLGLIVDWMTTLQMSEAQGLRIAFLFWVACQGFALAWLVLLPRQREKD
jgi:predicted MFS family arabinose efflux permease